MDKSDKELQIEAITKEFGTPEWDFDRTRLNEAARRISQLRALGLKSYNEAKKAKKTEKVVRSLIEQLPSLLRPVPDELIRPEYLVSFNDNQKLIVKQWLSNTDQSVKQIAEACCSTPALVRNTMSLEAFKALRLALTRGYTEIMPLEAVIALRECLRSKFDNIKFNAAETILRDQGILKDKSPETVVRNEVILDQDKMNELKDKANKLMGL